MPNERAFPFKLGADPEFNFVVQNRQNGRLRADSLMKDFFSGKRPHNSGYDIPGGNAGWDGAAATGEIRPKPENSPAALTANIGKIYKEICKRSPRAIKITVRSDTAPVGGHIHFELDDSTRDMSDSRARQITKRLSSFYAAVAMGEDMTNMNLRLNTSYGKFNDSRRENGKTFEYRAPSAEWQLTPKICEATLAYMGTVWYEAVHRPQSFKGLEFVYSNDRMGSYIQGMLAQNFSLFNKAILKEIRRAIKNFEYYPMFSEEIDYILQPERVLKDKQNALFCVNLGWGFEEQKAPTKKLINNEAQIRRNLSNIDIDRWLELFKVPYNPDDNVKEMVDALKKRILAYDWNMKNEYFMFGLKKGIKKPIIMDGNNKFVFGHDQIKTRRDNDQIMDTFNRMRQRMQRSFRTTAENSMMLGLPYDMRMKGEYRPIIELIYDLEKTPDKFPAEALKTSELVNDIESDPAEWGEIARAYMNQEGEIQMEMAQTPRHNPYDVALEADCDEDEDECPNCGAPNRDCDC